MHDPSAAAVTAARDFIAGHCRHGAARPAARRSADEIMALLTSRPDLAECGRRADLSGERPREPRVQGTLYPDLDRWRGRRRVLASSTSGLPASSSRRAGRPGALPGSHPINPPHLIPLVELVPAPWTTRAVVDRTETLLREVGQAPIRSSASQRLRRHRLQAALLSEASGRRRRCCEVGDVDAASRRPRAALVLHGRRTIDLNAPGGIADSAPSWARCTRSRKAQRWSGLDAGWCEGRRAAAPAAGAGLAGEPSRLRDASSPRWCWPIGSLAPAAP